MGKLDAPCKGCDKRYVGCHAKCSAYKDYKARSTEIHNEEYKDRLVTMQLIEIAHMRTKFR